jgi:hypothetical protein
MDKDVVGTIALDETVALRLVEPLHSSDFSLAHLSFGSFPSFLLQRGNEVLRGEKCPDL